MQDRVINRQFLINKLTTTPYENISELWMHVMFSLYGTTIPDYTEEGVHEENMEHKD